jgi:hypothetical protein
MPSYRLLLYYCVHDEPFLTASSYTNSLQQSGFQFDGTYSVSLAIATRDLI